MAIRTLIVDDEELARLRIREVQALDKGSYVLILANVTRVTSSATFRDAVDGLIGDHR